MDPIFYLVLVLYRDSVSNCIPETNRMSTTGLDPKHSREEMFISRSNNSILLVYIDPIISALSLNKSFRPTATD